MASKLPCRVCTILKGEPTVHDPKALHSNAPAIPIRTIIDAWLNRAENLKKASV